MKLAVLVVVAACHSGVDDYPVGGGGGGPVNVIPGHGDAGQGGGDGGDGDAGIPLEGRVCLLGDLRKIGDPTFCATTGALGLTVSLGRGPAVTTTATTVTDSGDGHFTILAPLGSDLTWHVTASTLDRIVPSAMPFGPVNTIPAVTTVVYTDLLNNNQATVLDQQGSIFARVVHGVAAVPGVTATSSLVSVNAAAPFYDADTSKELWSVAGPTGHTGSGGVVWFPGELVAASGPTVATLTLALPPPAGTTFTTTAAVENGVITFMTVAAP